MQISQQTIEFGLHIFYVVASMIGVVAFCYFTAIAQTNNSLRKSYKINDKRKRVR